MSHSSEVMDAAADAVEAGLLKYSEGAVVGTGGFIEDDVQRFNIRHVQPITEPAELGAVPVVERDGKVLRLADMGDVAIDHGPLIGDAVINDGPGMHARRPEISAAPTRSRSPAASRPR